jgi:hypothetical protein
MFLTTSVAIVVAWVFYEVVEVRLCRRFRAAVEWSIATLRGRLQFR